MTAKTITTIVGVQVFQEGWSFGHHFKKTEFGFFNFAINNKIEVGIDWKLYQNDHKDNCYNRMCPGFLKRVALWSPFEKHRIRIF